MRNICQNPEGGKERAAGRRNSMFEAGREQMMEQVEGIERKIEWG